MLFCHYHSKSACSLAKWRSRKTIRLLTDKYDTIRHDIWCGVA